jgi:hypothetical protein
MEARMLQEVAESTEALNAQAQSLAEALAGFAVRVLAWYEGVHPHESARRRELENLVLAQVKDTAHLHSSLQRVVEELSSNRDMRQYSDPPRVRSPVADTSQRWIEAVVQTAAPANARPSSHRQLDEDLDRLLNSNFGGSSGGGGFGFPATPDSVLRPPPPPPRVPPAAAAISAAAASRRGLEPPQPLAPLQQEFDGRRRAEELRED